MTPYKSLVPLCPTCSRHMQPLFTSMVCSNERCHPAARAVYRATRVVAKVPEIWHGASARMRIFESTPVTMILDAADVQPVQVWHNWMYISYSSASDFDFTSKSVLESIRQQVIQHGRWALGLPRANKDDLNKIFKADHILLVLGHGGK